MGSLAKLVGALVVLMIALIAFYFFIVVPNRDAERVRDYEKCKSDAELVYGFSWLDECRAISDEKAELLKQCINDADFHQVPGLAINECKRNIQVPPRDAECSLPSSVAERLTDRRDRAKQVCLNEAQLRL